MKAKVGKGEVGVAAVHRGLRLVMLDTGRMLPITAFLDAEGRETQNPEEAVQAIAGEDGLWLRVSLAAFERGRTH